MKSIHLFFLLAAALLPAGKGSGQVILPSPLSPRITQYHINAELDPDKKTVSGEMTVQWKNPSRDTVSELQFHLYLNAFKNGRSTFLSGRRSGLSEEKDWGYTDISSMNTGSGEVLTDQLRFIHPNESAAPTPLRLPDEKPFPPELYGKDQSVVSVRLASPVLPDSTVTVSIQFTSKLPKITARTGYSKDFFFVAQWFPKLGVYEPAGMRYARKGGWNTHQFFPNAEFYANHSLYTVDLTVPEEYVVGSGGQLMKETASGGKKTLSLRAEDIVDFAWTASKEYQIAEDQWKHVKIKVMLQPEHFYQAERHIQAVKYALEYLDTHVGPYPWPYVTVVDPPTYGQGAGGMEYTTLITAGTFYLIPKQIRMAEMVTVHEFGHAYFMGILANNEAEEPWLDEGINSYWENRIMDWAYGEKTAMIGFPFAHVGDVEFARISWLGGLTPNLVPTFNNSWSFPRGTYGATVYQKPATMLNTLERMVGQECMDEIFRKYYQRWAFRHPSTKDFIRVVNEVIRERGDYKYGPDLDWFFEQFLYGTASLDYSVQGIRISPAIGKGGLYDESSGKKFLQPENIKDRFRSVIMLSRKGDGIVPVEIRVRFDNGEEILENWDGKDKVFDLVYERKEKVVAATVDPGQKLLLDSNLLNNSFAVKPSAKPALKWAARFLFLVENIMHSLSLIV